MPVYACVYMYTHIHTWIRNSAVCALISMDTPLIKSLTYIYLMYVYMCKCIYARACMYTYIHTHFRNLRANFDGNKPLQVTHLHMFIYVYMCKCIYARVCMHIYKRTYTPTSVICALISMETNLFKSLIYICLYMYTCINVYI